MNAVQWVESRGVRIKSEGDKLTIEGLSSITPEQATHVVEYARENKARLLRELGQEVKLPWPEPESGNLETGSEPWKYAILVAIAAVYGVALTKTTWGRLGLACPASMPGDAAKAAWDGLEELKDYVRMRLACMGSD